MSTEYCFTINNPNNENINREEIKEYIKRLFLKGDSSTNPFLKLQELGKQRPYLITYNPELSDENLCISIVGSGKKNIQHIKNTIKNLSPNDLRFSNSITLSNPFKVRENLVYIAEYDDNGDNWKTLEYTYGPYFNHLSEPYIPLGASLKYGNTLYPLEPEEERVASYYASQKINDDSGETAAGMKGTKDSTFNTNYWNDFQKYLTPGHRAVFKDFSKIGWDDIMTKLLARREENKNLSSEEKRRKQEFRKEINKKYSYIILDGNRTKISKFNVELPGILRGRGDNPNRGKIKELVNPENVTINIGRGSRVPRPPQGHKWGAIISDPKKEWIASWKDTTQKRIVTKYVTIGGALIARTARRKYEISRKMNNYIDVIRRKYMTDVNSRDIKQRQLGTVLYLIDNFGLRVGGEKDKEETDTVGATTLRVEHLNLQKRNHVVFDFLGKDSVQFYKDLPVSPEIYNNIVSFVQGKIGANEVFDLVSDTSVNAYLKTIDKDLTAKMFRTRLASSIMHEQLLSKTVSKGSKKKQIQGLFNQANTIVANTLNHVRNVTQLDQEKILALRNEIEALKTQLNQERNEAKRIKLQEKISNKETDLEMKSNKSSNALATSLRNYIDPRIVVSWAMKQDIILGNDNEEEDEEKEDDGEEKDDTDKFKDKVIAMIYTKALMTFFMWALDSTDETWDYVNTPISTEISPTLVPIGEIHIPTTRINNVNSKPLVKHYQTILNYCQDPNKNSKLLSTVPREVFVWLQKFLKFAVSNNINTRTNLPLLAYCKAKKYCSYKEEKEEDIPLSRLKTRWSINK